MSEKFFEIEISTFCNGVKYASVTFVLQQWQKLTEVFVGGVSFDVSSSYDLVTIKTLGSFMELDFENCPEGGLTSDPNNYNPKLDWSAKIINTYSKQY